MVIPDVDNIILTQSMIFCVFGTELKQALSEKAGLFWIGEWNQNESLNAGIWFENTCSVDFVFNLESFWHHCWLVRLCQCKTLSRVTAGMVVTQGLFDLVHKRSSLRTLDSTSISYLVWRLALLLTCVLESCFTFIDALFVLHVCFLSLIFFNFTVQVSPVFYCCSSSDLSLRAVDFA